MRLIWIWAQKPPMTLKQLQANHEKAVQSLRRSATKLFKKRATELLTIVREEVPVTGFIMGNGDVFFRFDGPLKAAASVFPSDIWEETIDLQRNRLMEGTHMRGDLVISRKGKKALDELNELLTFCIDDRTLGVFEVKLKA